MDSTQGNNTKGTEVPRPKLKIERPGQTEHCNAKSEPKTTPSTTSVTDPVVEAKAALEKVLSAPEKTIEISPTDLKTKRPPPAESIEAKSNKKSGRVKKQEHRKEEVVAQNPPPISFNLIQSVPSEDKTAPKPDKSFGDYRRQMEQLLGSISELYMLPPFSLTFRGLSWNTPVCVSSTPFSYYFPYMYSFSYSIIPYYKANYPVLHVTKSMYRFGNLQMEIEALIEPDLLLRCFNQSTVRDYDTLLNSIFMTVNRGIPYDSLVCFDVNTKLEAIAALYYYRNPNFNGSINSILRVLGDYKPTIPGIYAVGSVNTPDFGAPPFEVHWKEMRTPAKALYVARLLDVDYAHIAPGYIPARTKEEFYKGFAKRLSSPSVDPQDAINMGIDVSEAHINEVVNYVVEYIIMKISDITRPLEEYPPERILDECRAHAMKRFTNPQEIAQYVEGARIAMFEPIRSHLFIQCLDGATNVGVFDKDEQYWKITALRLIMCPSVRVRGFTHALLMNAQRFIFGEGDHRNPKCVKHLTEEQRRDYVLQYFGTAEVFNTDYTSLESSVVAKWMRLIERPFFTRFTPAPMRDRVQALWDRYCGRQYHVSSKEFSFDMDPIRLSGTDHTSAGNYLINVVWLFTIVKLITNQVPDFDTFRFMCEGDDGLGVSRIPLLQIVPGDRPHYDVDPDAFLAVSKAMGARLKINIYATVNDSSFCGIKLAPTLVDGQPTDEFVYDPEQVLAKVLWDVGYDRATARHDSEKLFARCLSWLPRVKGQPELYQAIFYLAFTHQPSRPQATSAYYHNIVTRTFYKGDIADIPDIDVAGSLKKYCDKFHLPFTDNPIRPDLLAQPTANNFGMEVQTVDRPRSNFIQSIANFFVDDPDYGRREIDNPGGGRCWAYALFDVLVATNQLQVDQPHVRDRFAEQYDPNPRTDAEIAGELREGQSIVIENRHLSTLVRWSRVNGTVVSEPVSRRPDHFIRVYRPLLSRTLHAVSVRPFQPDEERIGLLGPKWIVLLMIIGVLSICLFVATRTQTIGGAALYCWIEVIFAIVSLLGFGAYIAPLKTYFYATLLVPLGGVCIIVAIVLWTCHLIRMTWRRHHELPAHDPPDPMAGIDRPVDPPAIPHPPIQPYGVFHRAWDWIKNKFAQIDRAIRDPLTIMRDRLHAFAMNHIHTIGLLFLSLPFIIYTVTLGPFHFIFALMMLFTSVIAHELRNAYYGDQPRVPCFYLVTAIMDLPLMIYALLL